MTEAVKPAGPWLRRRGAGRKLALLLTLAAAASGVATYGALTRSGPYGPDTETVIVLLYVDLALLLGLGAVVARHLLALWTSRRRRLAASRLQTRLVTAFSLAAILPAILVGTSSALFFTLGVEAWFSERVRVALARSADVAVAYVNEHASNMRAHVLAMAGDLDRAGPALYADEAGLNRTLETQAALREFSEALVFRGDGRVLGQTQLSFSLALSLELLPPAVLSQARPDRVQMLTARGGDRVRALVRLQSVADGYLIVGRLVDPVAIGHSQRVAGAVEEFQALEGRRGDLQIAFALVYAVAALLLLFAAVWFALQFAQRLVAPVAALAAATERVRGGDLSARVDDGDDRDELTALSRAFNRMTGQLDRQRRELVEANRQLDSRRRFTESVLSGVSAGVVGLNEDGTVELPNRRALALLGLARPALVGRRLDAVVPELGALLARARTARRASGNVELVREGHVTSLMVRIASERGEAGGYVVTFDDVTPLIAAQRKAAWSDVARRLSHEIKNPLTPIQLSAERLKRRYLPGIADAPEVFEACTDTIVRQVDDLRHIVDAFSDFARLPEPELAREDAVALVEAALALQEMARGDIVFERRYPDRHPPLLCDRRQIAQVLNNLVQNAVDAIAAGGGREGRVVATVAGEGASCIIRILDNGCGLPEVPNETLFEPYVTHRRKGTGLGLAIARRIVDDHGGRLALVPGEGGGACATLRLPLDRTASDAEARRAL